MSVGSIATSILTDIANAIRYKAGVATLYQPREMAAAVVALDGSNAGNYQPQSYMQLERGYLATDVFGDIADAIRGQNGQSTQYQPGDMAAAIRALTWDTGRKVRALLLDDNTLEFNYLDSPRTTMQGYTIVSTYEVDPNGYASDTARPWHGIRGQVWRVMFDESMADAALTNGNYWFKGFTSLVEVGKFDTMTTLTSATQMFSGCTSLRTIYIAGTFTNNITSGASMFYGCNRLVGSYDYFVPTNSSYGPTLCKYGAGGVLTTYTGDMRRWYWAYLYDDGVAKLQTTNTPDPWYEHEMVAGCQICAQGNYNSPGFTPWDSTNRQQLTSLVFDASMASYSDLNLNYLLYNCSNLTSVSGFENLSGVHSMRYLFAGCSSLVTADLRGLDPSALTDLFYTFSGCSSLTTILADATWALPASGISGNQCFYGCSSNLVGGNGTVWSSSNTGYTFMRIDAAGSPGYLTAG